MMAPSLPGEVTTVRQFRMGENDPGASAGAAAPVIHDSANSDNLVTTGSPLYSTDTPNAASTLSLSFDGSQNATTGSWHALTANFGAEAWVKPSSSGDSARYVMYSGDPDSTGWGLLQSANPDSRFSVILGGKIVFGSAPVTPGQWTHLAVVTGTDTSTFYVNGVAVATTPHVPAESSANIFVGSHPDGSQKFQGNIDEARIFTFSPGVFTPQDLGFAPEPAVPARPASLAIEKQGNDVVLTWPQSIVGHRLHTTTDPDLASWYPIYEREKNGDLYTLTQPITDPTRFYRLLPVIPENSIPRLIPGRAFTLKRGDAAPVAVTVGDPDFTFEGRHIMVFDASAYYDPAATQDEPLDYRWSITMADSSIYTSAGVTGYRTPVLTILANGIPNDRYNLRLTITSRASGMIATYVTNFTMIRSSMTLLTYKNCKGETTACGTCPCTNAYALPTKEPS